MDSNAADVADWFEEELEELEQEVEDTLDRAAKRTLEEARDKVPVDTGTLRDSLEREGRVVGSDESYAPHVGLGTIYQEGTDYLWGPAEEALEAELEKLGSS